MADAIYIHIPFCEQICHYCDFNKFYLKSQPVDEYVEDLITEMGIYADEHDEKEPVQSVYIGGGTPTSMSEKQLAKVIHDVRELFPLSESCEFTVEANPGSCDASMMKGLYNAGVNRLSIGVQTFDETLLSAINRDHEPGDAQKTVDMAREAGITNLSIDLMFGLPGQTMEQWKQTLKAALSLPITHISAYSLKIEPKTVFYQMQKKRQLRLPDEDLEADMFEELVANAKRTGFQHYEISNFAKPGFESRHNLVYWDNCEYYGFGAGAHGYLNGKRYANHGPLPKYMKAVSAGERPKREEHQVSSDAQKEEFMFMGLRKMAGVSLDDFEARYHTTMEETFPGVLEALKGDGLITVKDRQVSLTGDGQLLANHVFEKFLLGNEQ
ncbi:radical SAM family heme chaperone HemW [Salisediminibacterium selenitireducens]|uniref:Heme chaperone HemW n=1 Tax=Bacillus selenitireducens (strain ATCC 700615 / DSM 15326 / MLS10) TaxID=439292 RepID=D6XWB9_BACIE|nr:radical SAM family heme chaperone HemW [Salisediminibacterium selenitireducens]ADH99873.1 oxygen-independent coproporphyrinogen III oxidase [[Bacillus] selenitireducens MLS10]